MSPLVPKDFRAIELIRSLPIFGLLMRDNSKKLRIPDLNQEAWLVYDGLCPFCSRYAEFVQLNKKVKQLHLINAREEDNEIVQDAITRGFNLDEGIVLLLGGKYYYASDAMHLLSVLSDGKGVIGINNALIYEDVRLAKIFYPIFKFFRSLTLKVLRIPKLKY